MVLAAMYRLSEGYFRLGVGRGDLSVVIEAAMVDGLRSISGSGCVFKLPIE